MSWLKDGDGIVSKIERNDKSSVDILWHFSIESGGISEDFLIVVHILEEVNLWLLWNEVVYISKRVYLVTKSIVRGNLHNDSWS